MIGAEIPFREVWVIGSPIAGYILFNTVNNQIMGRFTKKNLSDLAKVI